MNITKKQFVISSKKLNIEAMDCLETTCGFLYASSLLNKEVQKNLLCEDCVLLGYAFSADKEGNTPKEEIGRWNEGDISKLTYDWTGRWALIHKNEIVSDAAGLMPLFYYIDESGWIISSSLAVMSKLIDKTPRMSVKPEGLSWHLLPDTIIGGVKKLLPFQKIVILENKLTIEDNVWAKDYTNLSTDEKCEAIASLLVTSIKNISKYSKKEIYLALTAGKDSRETLGAIIVSGIKDFKTYTFEHSNMLVADKKIPTKISKDFGFEHRYIVAKNEDDTKRKEYIDFCLGNSSGADEMFYARSQFDEIPKDVVIIRSGLYETGTLYHDAGQDFDKYYKKRYSEIETIKSQSRSFDTWKEYIQRKRLPYINDHDRFYLEQRVSGWVSAIEQSLDINDFVSIQIANNAHLLSLLLSETDEERKERKLSYGVIKRNVPKLLEYPINRFQINDYCRLAKKKLFGDNR